MLGLWWDISRCEAYRLFASVICSPVLTRWLTLKMQRHRFQTYLLIGSIVCAWVYCMLWIESAGNIYKNRKNHIHFRKDAVTIVSDRSEVLTKSDQVDCSTKTETMEEFFSFFFFFSFCRRVDGTIYFSSSSPASFYWAVNIWSLLAPLRVGSSPGDTLIDIIIHT